MAVVGYATLQIIPSVRGLQGALQGELRGAGNVGGVAGDALGQGVTGRFRSAIGGLMDGVGRTISAAATGVGLIAGTAMGVSLFRGFERVTTIQDATRALAITLGDATKAGDLLAKVLKIVTGTPFALDQFAAAAQQLISFGVAADKVPGILTAVGDASATQGKRAGQFAGQLIDVFGQIAAKGRVQLQDVWRISETGVNALAILANKFGVTTAEMQKMIEKGAVPAGAAIDALVVGIENGSKGIAGQTVALGGLAQALGETLSGSLANLKIAFSRFGASVITPLTGPLTTAFQTLRTLIDDLGKRISTALTTLVASPGFKSFMDWITTLPAKIGPILSSLGSLAPIVAPIAAALGAIASTNLGNMLGPLGAFLPSISPVLAALGALIAFSAPLRDTFMTLASTIGTTLGEVFRILAPTIAIVADALSGVLGVALTSLSDLFIAIAPTIKTVAEALGGALGTAITAIASALGPVLVQITPSLISIAKSFGDIALSLVPLIPAFAQLVVAALPLVPPLVKLVELAARFIAALPPEVLLAIVGVFILLNSEVVAAVAIAAVLVATWEKVQPVFAKIFNWIKSNWPLLLAILTGPFGLAALAIIKNFDKIIDFFKKLPGEIVKALGNAGKILFDVGKKIIGGLIDGLKSALGGVKDTLGGVAKKIVSWKGPPAKDAVLLYRNGQLIIESLIDGFVSKFGSVESTLGGLSGNMARQFRPFDASVNASASAAGGSSVPTGTPIIVHSQVLLDKRVLGEATSESMYERDRARQ